MPSGFQCLRDGSEALRYLTGNTGRPLGRIERHWLSPDAYEPLADLGFPQVLQVDAERLPVGELVVGFPITAEIGIDLETVAHVAHDDEWWWLVTWRQQVDVVFSLPSSI